MNIVVSYDQAIGTLPGGFTSAVSAVVALYQGQYTDNITFNLHVGYGEVHGTALGSGALGQSNYFLNTYTYAQIRNALVADAKTTDDTTALGNVPSVDPIGGTHTYWVAQVQAKALGLLSNATVIDQYVGFSNTATFDYDRSDGITASQYDFFGTVAHEIAEVMGKNLLVGATIGSTTNSYDPSDLFHYSASGVRVLSGTASGYFSINGGATNLDNFNTNPGGDFGDWASSAGNDSWRAFSNPGVVNAVTETDLKFLDVIGFDRAAPAGSISINDMTIAEGNAGTRVATFTVTRTGGTAAFAVSFATADGTATTADNDYVANAGTLNFGVGVNTQTISVTIKGDTKVESDETFLVNLSGATNGATISDGQGVGTILNDEALVLTGTSGNDTLVGGLGNDTLSGGVSVLSFGANGATDRIADFNGDHKAEVIQLNQNGSLDVWLSTGSSLDNYAQWGSGSQPSDKLGDFNHDGKTDVVQFFGGNAYVWLSNGGGFNNYAPWGSGFSPNDQLADFNGDGKTDAVQLNGGNAYVWLSNGTSFNNYNLWGSGFSPNDKFADFNNDHKTDAIQFTAGNAYVWLSNGNGFGNYTQWGSGFSPNDQLADFSGDGKADVIQFNGGNAYVWLSNGTGFSNYTQWGSGFSPNDKLADFNGDGKTDVLQFNGGNAYVWLSNGTGFSNYTLWGSGFSPNDQFGDFNGDGKTDVIQFNGDTSYVWLSNGTSFTPYTAWGKGDGAGNGTGNDTFVFNVGFGKDIITDFQAGPGVGDVIQFDHTLFADLASVLSHTADDGHGNTVITYDANDTVTLNHVLKANLTANDFQFV